MTPAAEPRGLRFSELANHIDPRSVPPLCASHTEGSPSLVAARKRDAIEEKMTLVQIVEAQRLAREWKATSATR